MNPKHEIIWTNVAENDLKEIIEACRAVCELVKTRLEKARKVLYVIQSISFLGGFSGNTK